MAESVPADVPTVLGPDCNFKGEFSFDKAMRVHGRLEGKITSSGRLHVARDAKVQAEVDAATIIVEGQLRGTLTAADRIELKQSARYEGDIKAHRMIVEEGAVFSGHVSVGPEAVKNIPHVAPSRNGNGPLVTAPMPAALTR